MTNTDETPQSARYHAGRAHGRCQVAARRAAQRISVAVMRSHGGTLGATRSSTDAPRRFSCHQTRGTDSARSRPTDGRKVVPMGGGLLARNGHGPNRNGQAVSPRDSARTSGVFQSAECRADNLAGQEQICLLALLRDDRQVDDCRRTRPRRPGPPGITVAAGGDVRHPAWRTGTDLW